MSRVRIGVLMGGKSVEKEVSLNTGRTVCDHLDTSKYEVIPFFQATDGRIYILPWHFLHRGKISDFERRLSSEAQKVAWDELKNFVDCLYIALHGRYAEDGTLQGLLEILKIPYVGSKVFASALGMDKIRQKIFLTAAGIKVPDGISLEPHEFAKHKEYTFSYPCVVKPYHEGSSFGVQIVNTPEDLYPALVQASVADPNKPQAVIIEEYVEGMEFSCIILTDYMNSRPLPLPPTEIVVEKKGTVFDYTQKYMPGRAIKYTPARCSAQALEKIQETCIKVMQVLGITNLARVDGFLTANGEVVIIDPNSFAGMAPSSFTFLQAAEIDMSPTHLINHLIATELSHYEFEDMKAAPSSDHGAENVLQKKRVAVIFGGASNEREISLESGRNVFYKLSPHKYEAILLFLTPSLELYHVDQRILVRNTTLEIQEAITPAMKILWSALPELVDFVFIALHGGEGENGSIQGMLEMLGVPYNGSSVLTSALCMDKYRTTQFLKNLSFDVPQNILVSYSAWQDGSWERMLQGLPGYPLIVKPHDDGCSVMVHKVHDEIELRQALTALFASGKTFALVEEYIRGMELTVGVLGNNEPYALPPSKAVAGAGILSIEEKFLPGAGENQTPAPLPFAAIQLVQQTMERAYKALNCKGYARIDCFYQTAQENELNRDRVVIIEVNTLPGLTPATCLFHQAAELGVKPMDFIDYIVQLGFEEHTQKLDESASAFFKLTFNREFKITL
jgi:D-alanine--D-alanine ligase